VATAAQPGFRFTARETYFTDRETNETYFTSRETYFTKDRVS
jgi:hypothetical protein